MSPRRRPDLDALLTRLGGVPRDRLPDQLTRPGGGVPWFLWAISALGAFLSGLLLLAAIFLLLEPLGHDHLEVTGFLAGAAVFAAAAVLELRLRHHGSLFLHTLILTLVMGGAMAMVLATLVGAPSLWIGALLAWALTLLVTPLLRAPLLTMTGAAGAMTITLAAIYERAWSVLSPWQTMGVAAVTALGVAVALALLLAPPRRAPDLRPAAVAMAVVPVIFLQNEPMLSAAALLGTAPYALAALAGLWRLVSPWRWALLAVPLLALAALSPGAAGALLALVLAFTLGNRWLAALGVVGLVAALSHLYYSLDITLLEKSAVLAAAGLVTLAGWGLLGSGPRRPLAVPMRLAWADGRGALLGTVAGLALVLGTFVWQVRSNEAIRTDGVELHVALAPADPRSLLQGDYMALAYDQERLVPPGQRRADLPARGVLVVRRDPETLEVQALRLHDPAGPPLAADEHLLAYWTRWGWLVVGAESYFFQEGTGRPLEGASHGVLRVAADGTALLVGLR